MRVLVIEDDPAILANITHHLTRRGYIVDCAEDGLRGYAMAADGGFDLIVLDLMLPRLDGYDLCRQLRAEAGCGTPIIMVTARDTLDNRLAGFDAGADDYLVKPFVARELLARIKAILRRTRMLPPNFQVTEPGRAVRFGAWTLDTTARHLLDAEGTIVSLSGAEYRLLRVFLDHPQRVLNRDQLLNLTQGRDADFFGRSIDLLVSRLRQRLREDAREPMYIKTVRSEGYVFAAQVDVSEAT